jgi:hypothetical protein
VLPILCGADHQASNLSNNVIRVEVTNENRKSRDGSNLETKDVPISSQENKLTSNRLSYDTNGATIIYKLDPKHVKPLTNVISDLTTLRENVNTTPTFSHKRQSTLLI